MSTNTSDTATATGIVSAEAAAGETITLVLTQPDASTQTTTVQTTADTTTPTQGDFSGAVFTITQDGNYSLVASVPADSTYQAATSAPYTFTVSDILSPRVISISGVTVS